jgi:hypothetical protein
LVFKLPSPSSFFDRLLHKSTFPTTSNMPLSDIDQDITPIPRSREENQERYVLPDGGERKNKY